MAVHAQTFFGDRYVPLKAALDGIGGRVEWDNAAKRATVHTSGKTILLTLAQTKVEVNGAVVNLSAPPLVEDGTLYVPEDFFANVVGQSIQVL